MANLANYDISQSVVVINGRTITDWGETATPFTDAPIDPKRVLRRGMGGRAVVLARSNNGRTVTLNLNPASPDSAFMSGLLKTGATIELSYTHIGTLESAIGTEGTVVNDGQRGRAGTTITDDQFIIEFNVWDGNYGG